MYTLRTFKNKSEVDRLQIYLGDSYQVKGSSEKDQEKGIIMRIYGTHDPSTKEGLAIYKDYYAFIMNHQGTTFETLNRPSNKLCNSVRKLDDEELINEMSALINNADLPIELEKYWKPMELNLRDRLGLEIPEDLVKEN